MNRKEEILQRIEKIEKHLFSLDMIDHWEEDIKEKYNELLNEKLKLEEELEKLENE